MNPKISFFLLTAVLLVTASLRLWDLGYSNFYGDETKTLFVRKDVSAKDFMFSQRKGPTQFLAVWGMEKLAGYNSELYARLPFAISGTLVVLVIYLLISRLYGNLAALFSATLYSFSGMAVAFSRTAQYQSILILFGLLTLYFLMLALDKKNGVLYLLAGICLAIASLSHYDAVFFIVPCLLFLFYGRDNLDWRSLILFLVPFLLISMFFYVPYFFQGYFAENAWGYLSRRFDGTNQLPSSNFWTFYVYNPHPIYFIPLFLGLFAIFVDFKKFGKIVFLWFIVPFILYTAVIRNPGTHIQMFLIPIIIVSGVTISFIYDRLKASGSKFVAKGLLFSSILSVFVMLFFTALIYLPKFSQGYPWEKPSKLAGNITTVPNNQYQLFLYGFPYNRGWDQIRDFFMQENRVEGFYSNDNEVTAKYYLREFSSTPPGPNFYPQYYIEVNSDLNFSERPPLMQKAFEQALYSKVLDVWSERDLVAVIYRNIGATIRNDKN